MERLSSAKDDLDLTKLFNLRDKLRASAIKGLWENREALTFVDGEIRCIKEGEIPLDDICALTTYVTNAFHDLDNQRKGGFEDIENSKEMRKVRKLLVFSSCVTPNLVGDWEVNRVKGAEYSLGLKSFEKLERTLAKRYPLTTPDDPVFRHLEKGPGNGEAMRRRQENNKALPQGERFEQYGIADRLYYPIEQILERFVRPELKEDKNIHEFIKLLGLALRQKLKSLWFEAPDNQRGHWIPKLKVFDINIIYELLSFSEEKPERRVWLSDWYDAATGKYRISQEFENDGEARMSEVVHRLFLELEGFATGEKEMMVAIAEQDDLEDESFTVTEKVEALESLIAYIESCPDLSQELLVKLAKRAVRISSVSFIPVSEVTFRKDLLLYLAEIILNFSKQLDDIAERKKRVEAKVTIYDETPPFSAAISGLRKIFIEEFLKGVETPASLAPDLNEYVSVHTQNIVLDRFENLSNDNGRKGPFPSQSLSLITAVRSDSHENDEEFARDIESNLDLLKPGGVLLTDGIRASYSRVYRFDQVKEIIDRKNGEYKAEIVMDKYTGEPISLFIQRRSDAGYLTDEDKVDCFDERAIFESLDEARQRPHVQILNTIRKNIMDVFGHMEVFRELHASLRTQVDYALPQQFVEDTPEDQLYALFGPSFSDSYHTPWIYQDILQGIAVNDIKIPEPVVQGVVDHVWNDMKRALRNAG